eukprot:966106-Rhodomonas_salina.1
MREERRGGGEREGGEGDRGSGGEGEEGGGLESAVPRRELCPLSLQPQHLFATSRRRLKQPCASRVKGPCTPCAETVYSVCSDSALRVQRSSRAEIWSPRSNHIHTHSALPAYHLL